MSDELSLLDATAQAELVRTGKLSAAELVEAAIARLSRLNPSLNAVIHPALERARQRAQSPSLAAGPLRGVPFLMKDIGGAEAGEPCHCGMRFLKDAGWRESQDSYLTQRFVAAGLISLGRTNTPELALLPTTEPEAYGATHNPWQLGFSSGGSSGGAAAAVAAGIVPAAHASDGGGSIRGPASACGLVGLKPSRGRNSFGPGLGERWSGFSAEFALTRSVRDTALLLDLTAGPMPGDPYWAPPPARPYAQEVGAPTGHLRIGLMRRGPRDVQVHPECVVAVDKTARVLESLGHRVELAHPPALDEAQSIAVYAGVVATNVARALEAWGEKVGRAVTRADVELLTWALAELGRQASGTQLLGMIEYVHGFGRRLAAFWQGGFDLLLTPTMGALPAALGELSSTPEEPLRALLRAAPYGAFTLPFNLSGQPAISLPAHVTPDGLPVGTQLVAAAGREDLLLRVASQLELAAPWAQRLPPHHA
ncbi:MAG TPA: amidase [Polyangiales bacterium]